MQTRSRTGRDGNDSNRLSFAWQSTKPQLPSLHTAPTSQETTIDLRDLQHSLLTLALELEKLRVTEESTKS